MIAWARPLTLIGLVALVGCSTTFSDKDGSIRDGVAADGLAGADRGGSDSAIFTDGPDRDASRDSAQVNDQQVFDVATPDAKVPDSWSGVIGVVIHESNTCVVTTKPSSISVPAGTEFTVNWINTPASASAVDVAKIDKFNQVPIVIGLKQGTSYHDKVRAWCGKLFTGTFSFRITGCHNPYYLPVNCSK